MSSASEEAIQRAIDLAADTMSEIIAFWGFKGSTGRIWTLLYLSPRPLHADDIAAKTHLSGGAVSMAISELLHWGLIRRASLSNQRKRHYEAATNIWAIVRRIIRERELRLVAHAIERFTDAVTILEEAQQQEDASADIPFMVERLRRLLKLSKTGYRLVETFADIGQFSLDPIRGLLSYLGGSRSESRANES